MKRLILLAVVALSAGTALSQQATFTSSGTWTVPAGVTSITVEVVGAGGNGQPNGRGGGGGGGYASGTFTVVPATAHTITVGTAGSTASTGVSGLGIQATAGANAPNVTTALGGAGGVGSGGTVNRTGGAGGTGTYTYFGGGGGGAAGPTANGGAGGNTPAWTGSNCLTPGGTGGTSGGAPGGAGGKGAGFIDNSCNGANPAGAGANYGGGGGGGNGNSSPAAAGANGYVVITWCSAAAAPTGAASQSFCSYANATVADLAATGTAIKWYTSATGGTPLAASTPLTAGQYFASQTISGCESATRLAVTVSITTLNLATNLAGSTITSAATGATYQWINCANNQAIPAATAASYTATANGSYAVIILQNGCRDTSACVAVTTVSVGDVKVNDAISLYPNPTSDAITIKVRSTLIGTGYSITDGVGRKVKEGKLTAETTQVSVRDLAKGIYQFRAAGQAGQSFKVVKQ